MTTPLKAEIRDFIVDNFLFGEAADAPTDEQSLVEAGLIDSLGVAELVAFIEARFEITAEDDELIPDNLDSIDRIAAFIGKKRGGEAVAA
ncbi:MAG: acyl carrier protein [Caulobacteraceae bacterium]